MISLKQNTESKISGIPYVAENLSFLSLEEFRPHSMLTAQVHFLFKKFI